jgi:hypothetical protein
LFGGDLGQKGMKIATSDGPFEALWTTHGVIVEYPLRIFGGDSGRTIVD